MAVGYPRVFVPPIAFLADRDWPGPAVQSVGVSLTQPDLRREAVRAQPVRVPYTHVHSLPWWRHPLSSKTDRVAPLPFFHEASPPLLSTCVANQTRPVWPQLL